MRGRVLIYDDYTKRGIIEDNQNNQYNFHIGEWLSGKPIVVGEEVSFEIPREDALNIRVQKRQSFLDFFFKRGKKAF